MTNQTPAHAVLITIPLSHYCEKARWGLDRTQLPYREEPHAPLFHRLATRRNHGRTVPVLVYGKQRFIDSTDILVHADATMGGNLLYPRDVALRREVEALEERFDTELGPHTRRWGYAHLMSQPTLLRSVWSREASWFEASLLPLITPLLRRLVRTGYRITPEKARHSLERVRAVFQEVDARLRDGRRFLIGERFTAADLTFAALAPRYYFLPNAVLPILRSTPCRLPCVRRWRDSGTPMPDASRCACIRRNAPAGRRHRSHDGGRDSEGGRDFQIGRRQGSGAAGTLLTTHGHLRFHSERGHEIFGARGIFPAGVRTAHHGSAAHVRLSEQYHTAASTARL